MKYCNSAVILLDWVCLVIDLNIKSQIINASKKRIPELEIMIKKQNKIITQLDTETFRIKESLNRCKNHSTICEDGSELSLTTKPYFPTTENEIRNLTPTAISGSLLQLSNTLTSAFPNFQSAILYGEAPTYINRDIITFENEAESMGCCRMNFFCL